MSASARAVALAAIAGALAAAVLGLVRSEAAIVWLLRVLAGGLFVLILPGLLAVLAWRPRATFGLVELSAIAIGISAALVQLLTVGALIYGWSVGVSLGCLSVWMAVHAAAALRRDGPAIAASPGDLALLGVLLVLSTILYAAGSPIDTTEPRIHVALVRRLLDLTSPSIYTTYLAPGIVYTYPFPGTHYLFALIARLEGIDPLFLYQKARALWGIAAPLLVYGCTLAFFGSRRIAQAATVVALALVANGVFGAVPDFSWAQLAPYSHASDVAMGVLLPALLLLTAESLRSATRRDTRFFAAAALALAAMLVMVHPREIVQFVVYLAALAAAALVVGAPRRLAIRAVAFTAAAIVFMTVYREWQTGVATEAAALVERERNAIVALLRGASWRELLGRPVPVLREYVVAFPVFFYGWNAVVLLVSPLVLFVLRRRPLALLPAAAIAAYLLIVRIPALALPYLYGTYFEMLYTPVRNVIFFVHLLAGVSLYLAAAALARHRPLVALPAAAGIVGAAYGISAAGGWLAASPDRMDWLFIPVLAAFAALAWRARATADRAESPWIEYPRPRWRLLFAVICVPLVLATERPDQSLRQVRWEPADRSPAASFAALPCLGAGAFCPPPERLVRFARTRVPVTSVFAVDLEDEYQPALFMPQQMTAWPGEAQGLIPRVVFVRYYQHYDRAQAAHGEQPFFNLHETRAERLAFIRDLHVTHVLLNPRVYAMMSPLLREDAELFTPQYDDGRWALYEVAARYRSLRL